ncbi:MAG: hypothetical protein V7754_02290 [Halioglobus sp.]
MKRLNEKFSIKNGNNHLCVVEGKGGIPAIYIRNKFATAIISLQGAHSSDSGLPAHGLARTAMWDIQGTQEL